MPLAQNDAPNRHRRGFSLIELVVVMVTLAIVIPLIIRFTTNTLDLSDSQVSRARMLAIADEAIVQVEADLKAARSCRASLLDPPVIAITPNSIEFVADLTGDGRGSYVRYEIEDTEIGRLLVRTTSTIPDGFSSETERCSWTVEANQTREVIAELPEGADGGFMAIHPRDGEVTNRQCRGLTEDFNQCKFTAVVVEITQRSLVPDSPDLTITKEILIDQRWGRT